jgi:hypothetical protein
LDLFEVVALMRVCSRPDIYYHVIRVFSEISQGVLLQVEMENGQLESARDVWVEVSVPEEGGDPSARVAQEQVSRAPNTLAINKVMSAVLFQLHVVVHARKWSNMLSTPAWQPWT